MLSIHAGLHESYVEQLRAKVDRGLSDGFRQGRNIHAPCFGYKLVSTVDAEGKPAVGPKGKPLMRKVTDDEQAPMVHDAFEKFTQGWSRMRIASI